jgi:uncharacterized membrane protein
MENNAGTAWKALGLGGIAGLRSMAAPAILSRSIAEGYLDNLEGSSFAALGSPGVSRALRILEVGEMVGDKLPIAPSRTFVPALLVRAASGALVGAALFTSARGGRRVAAGGAALGAISALTTSYAGEKLRVDGAQRLGVPSIVLALLEDGLVLFGGNRLLGR